MASIFCRSECADCGRQPLERVVAEDFTPDLVSELPLCQELAGVQDEQLQQFVLIRREFDVAIQI